MPAFPKCYLDLVFNGHFLLIRDADMNWGIWAFELKCETLTSGDIK